MTKPTFAILAAALAFAACSDDAAGPTGDQLTRAEATVIAGAVAANGGQTANPPAASSTTMNASAADPLDITRTLELNLVCPAGGSVQQRWTVDASVDMSTGNFTLDVTGFQKHLACAFPHEGITITVDGDPDINMEAHASAANHVAGQHTLSLDGAFRWSASDGRSGTCPIALDAVTDFGARTRNVEGTVCGHTITETTSWN